MYTLGNMISGALIGNTIYSLFKHCDYVHAAFLIIAYIWMLVLIAKE